MCDSSSAVNGFEIFQAYKVIINNNQKKGHSLWFMLILIHTVVTKAIGDLLRSIQLYRGAHLKHYESNEQSKQSPPFWRVSALAGS